MRAWACSRHTAAFAIRTALIPGWAAMAGAAAFVIVVGLASLFPDSAIRIKGKKMAAFSMLALGFIHVFAIFSQTLSSGRNPVGAIALPTLCGGLILMVILAHVVRVFQ